MIRFQKIRKDHVCMISIRSQAQKSKTERRRRKFPNFSKQPVETNSMSAVKSISYAVMAHRMEPASSADLFPTPPWATRTLVEWLIQRGVLVGDQHCWEPAAGLGHMSRTLSEFFSSVYASDAFDYGLGHEVSDFRCAGYHQKFDWIITNPPFNLAEEFSRTAIVKAKVGVAMLVRTTFLEGIKRYQNLFSRTPPTYVLQFTERVPMHRGRLEANGSTATAYCWLVWFVSGDNGGTRLCWLPPSRKRLERLDDYDIAPLPPPQEADCPCAET
jgi:hypothetical protein